MGIGQLQVLWLSQVRPMCACKLISPRIRRPVDSLSVRDIPSDHRAAMQHNQRNFLCLLSIPCNACMQPGTRRSSPEATVPTPDLEPGNDDVNKRPVARHGRSSSRRVSIGFDEEKLEIGQAPHHPLQLSSFGAHKLHLFYMNQGFPQLVGCRGGSEILGCCFTLPSVAPSGQST